MTPPERRKSSDLSERDRGLVRVCIDRYIADLRSACEEDQGTPEGAPGTLGHELQVELRGLREKVA